MTERKTFSLVREEVMSVAKPGKLMIIWQLWITV